MTLEEKLEEIDEMNYGDLLDYVGICKFEAEDEGYDRLDLLEMAREMAQEESYDEEEE